MRVALWQSPHPPAGDTAHALKALAEAASDAAAQDADWLITPEMALTGYLIDPARLHALAEPADGALAQAVARIARQQGIGIVYGWPETHPQGGKPYNAAQAIGPQGQRLAVHRKVHLFGPADAERFSLGDAVAAPFDWGGHRLGMLICFDAEQPAAVRELARQGAEAVLVPTANMLPYDDAPLLTIPRLAAACRVGVAYANACGAEGTTRYGGLSTVVGPHGEVRARAGREAVLLVADLLVGAGRR